MATAEKIYIDRTNKRLLKHSDGQFQPTSAQDLLLASHNGQIPIEVYGIERTEASGYGAYSAEGYTSASYATDDLRVVIGPCGECQLVSGTFKLTHTTFDTPAIDVDNLSADVIERALNGLTSIRSAGSVQVTQVRGALKFVVEGNTNGALTAFTVSELSLVPDSTISIVEVDPGTATTKARYVMTIRPQPFAQLTTWAAVSAASITISELTAGGSTQYETQRVAITGPIYGGYFTLTDGSNVTSPIAVTATASTVEDQVNAVLGASTVTVSKPRPGVWDIRWATTGNKTILTVAGAVESYSGVSGTLALNTVNLSAAIEGRGELPGKFQIVETISGTEQRLIYEEIIQLREEIVSDGSLNTIDSPLSSLKGISIFTAATQAATAPDYVGQLGVETDTGIVYVGDSTAAGDWSAAANDGKTYVTTAAQLAAVTSGHCHIIDNITLTADIALPHHVTVEVESGVVIDPSGNTLTIQGELVAYGQVFPGGFTGTINGNFGGAAINPHWFGAGFKTLDITADAGNDQITATSHGLTSGDRVVFINTPASGSAQDLPAPLVALTAYAVVVVDANTLTLETIAGAAIDITDAGTGTHRMAKEVSREMQAAIDATAIIYETSGRHPRVSIPKGAYYMANPLYLMSKDQRLALNPVIEGGGLESTRLMFLAHSWAPYTPAIMAGTNNTAGNRWAFGTTIRDLYIYVAGNAESNGIGMSASIETGSQFTRLTMLGCGRSLFDYPDFSISYANGAGEDQFTADVFTSSNHGLYPGQVLVHTNTGAANTTLTASKYFVANVTKNTFQLATTMANALASPAVVITGINSGDDGTLANQSATTYQNEISFVHSGARPNGHSRFAYLGSGVIITSIEQVTYNGALIAPTIYDSPAICTVSGGDTLTDQDHRLEDGDEVILHYRRDNDPHHALALANFGNGSPNHPTNAGSGMSGYYYVVESTADTFKVASSAGGAALPLESIDSGNEMCYFLKRFKKSIEGASSSIAITRVQGTNLEDTDLALDFQHRLVAREIGTFASKVVARVSGQNSGIDISNIKNQSQVGTHPDVKDDQVNAWRRGDYRRIRGISNSSRYANGAILVDPISRPYGATLPKCWWNLRTGTGGWSNQDGLASGDVIATLYETMGTGSHFTDSGSTSPTYQATSIGGVNFNNVTFSGTKWMVAELPEPHFPEEFTILVAMSRPSGTNNTDLVLKLGYKADNNVAHAQINCNDTGTPIYVDAAFGDGVTTATLTSNPVTILGGDGGVNVVALRFKLSNQTLWVNGAKFNTDTQFKSDNLFDAFPCIIAGGSESIGVTAASTYFSVGDRVYFYAESGVPTNLPQNIRKPQMWVTAVSATAIEVATTKGGTAVTVAAPAAGTVYVVRSPKLYIGSDTAKAGNLRIFETMYFDHALGDAQVDEWARFVRGQFNITDGSEFTTWSTRATQAGRIIDAIESHVTTTAAQRAAIETFATTIDWTLYEGVFLTTWASAAANVINWVYPNRSATIAGTITHSAGYATGNGTNGVMKLGINPSTISITNNDAMLAYYCAQEDAGTPIDMGAFDGTNAFELMQNANLMIWDCLNAVATPTGGRVSVSNSGVGNGLIIGNRVSGVRRIVRKITASETELVTASDSSAGTAPNLELYSFARNASGSAAGFSSRDYSMFVVGRGHTSGEVTTFASAAYTLLAALGVSTV